MRAEEEKGSSYYNALAVEAVADEQAFSELYEHFFPRIYNFLFSRMKMADAADEVTSITFEKMFVHLAEYQSDKAAFSTWLFRIAQNGMMDYFRRQEHKKEAVWEDFFDPADEGLTPESEALQQEGNAELLMALDGLKERERHIVELKYFSGLSNQEIAALEGISAGNVRVILFRAIGTLKKILADGCNE